MYINTYLNKFFIGSKSVGFQLDFNWISFIYVHSFMARRSMKFRHKLLQLEVFWLAKRLCGTLMKQETK